MAVSCIKSRILQGIIEAIDGAPVSEELEATLERIRRMLGLPRKSSDERVGFYVLSKLHTFQNMKSFRVDKDTDIAAYVRQLRHATILHDSTSVYRHAISLLRPTILVF